MKTMEIHMGEGDDALFRLRYELWWLYCFVGFSKFFLDVPFFVGKDELSLFEVLYMVVFQI